MREDKQEAVVSIEPLTAEHYAVVAQWLSNPAANKFLDSELRGKRVDERMITVLCMNPKNKLYLACNEGKACGLVGLWKIDTIDKTAGVLILLGNRTLGRGAVMPIAGRLLARKAFEELALESLFSAVMTPNLPSRLVTHAMGFRHVGTWPNAADLDGKRVDREIYSMTLADLNAAESERDT